MSIESPEFVELALPGTSRKYSNEERQNHCIDWKRSGLSMSEYCRQSGLTVSSLSKWVSDESKGKLATEKLQEKSSITPTPFSAGAGVEIILVSGIRMRFIKTPISEVLRFIKALES